MGDGQTLGKDRLYLNSDYRDSSLITASMTMIATEREMTTTLRPHRSPLPLPEPLSNAPYLGPQFLQASLSSLSSSIAATVSPSDLSLPKYAAQVVWQADDLAIAHLRVVSFLNTLRGTK